MEIHFWIVFNHLVYILFPLLSNICNNIKRLLYRYVIVNNFVSNFLTTLDIKFENKTRARRPELVDEIQTRLY